MPPSPSSSESIAPNPTETAPRPIAPPPEAISGRTIDIKLVDPDAIKVVERLRRYDHAAYLVGGCVRDLLLAGKPKDFDVATSATPNEIRRLFRNCRIIGRRFRLAHVFFGSKVIETATFRANPREVEEETGDGAARPPEGERPSDLLIRRDNVFGTAEEDARRRDFTINGLFLDVESGHVIDYVGGMPDIEARLVRTIGDPDIRFREDPVRILRAVKFAARCNLTIEPETYRRMLDHSGEITKCATARVSEEFFRLLRAGAAKRSMEILLETQLLELLVPKLAGWLRAVDADDPTLAQQHKLFWSYLEALDRQTAKRGDNPSNALVLTTLLLSPLREALDPDNNTVRDIGQRVGEVASPIIDQLKASRRDSDIARQVLVSLRHVLPSKQGQRRRPRFGGRDIMEETLRLLELVADAEGLDASLAKQVAAELAPPPRAPLPSGPLAAAEPVAREANGRTAIPELPAWLLPQPRPSFLGTGAFGRWMRGLD